jgi:hypothetical protein
MNWRRTVADSRIAGWMRAASPSRLIAPVVRPLTRRLPFLERDIQAPRGDEDRETVHMLEDSAVVTAIVATLVRIRAAAAESVTGRSVGRLVASVRARPLAARIRLASVMLLSAVITHLVMTRFDAPEPLFIVRATWTAIALLLAFCCAAAPAIAAAWRDRQ